MTDPLFLLLRDKNVSGCPMSSVSQGHSASVGK